MQKMSKLEVYLKKKPFCTTFICLLKKEGLPDGIMPNWFSALVNWSIRD